MGITIQDNLSPEKHINKIIGGTYRLLTSMKIAFNYMDEQMLSKIISTMIRPRLEYAAVVWSPHLKKHINKMERVQRIATKMIPELKGLKYEERLERLGLPTLKERRERGDMITMFKCVKKFENIDIENFVEKDDGRTRGHSLKLRKKRCGSDVRKYSFPNRTIENWNRLDSRIVDAENIHIFKARLDKRNRSTNGTTRA